MDKQSQPEKREMRPAGNPDSRQAEMDARHRESLAWRNTARAEDLDWRQAARREDREWRAEVRTEDRQHRLRSERITKRCHALSAAAFASKPGSSLESVLALAQKFEDWLNSEDK